MTSQARRLSNNEVIPRTVQYNNGSTVQYNERGIPWSITFHNPRRLLSSQFFTQQRPTTPPKKKSGKNPKPIVGTNTLSRNLNWVDPISLKPVKQKRAYYLQPNANSRNGTVHAVYSLRSLKRWLGSKGQTTSPTTRIPYTRKNIRRVPRPQK